MKSSPLMTPDLHRRSGTAMTEMVLALPILIAILLLVLYFGREVLHVQVVQTVDRYEAWRRAAQQPESDAGAWSVMQPDATASISLSSSTGFPSDARDAIYQHLQGPSPDAADLLDRAFEAFADGRRGIAQATHVNGISAWPTLSGQVVHQHVRLDGDWAYLGAWANVQGQAWQDFRGWAMQTWPVSSDYWGNWAYWTSHGSWMRQRDDLNNQAPPWMMHVANDAFFTTFDASVESLESQGNGLAAALRLCYRGQPTAMTGPGVIVTPP